MRAPGPRMDAAKRETAKALDNPAVQARLATLGVEPMSMTQAEFAKFLRDDIEANVALVKAAKIPTQ